MKQAMLLLGAALAFAAAVGTAHAGTVTVDFSGLTDGQSVGNTYASEGLTFSPDAMVETCSGGCPLPNPDGNFANTGDTTAFTADFAAPQSDITFQSVSFSSTLAQAFNSSNVLVDSVTDDEDFPVSNQINTLSGVGITRVEFSYNGGQVGPAITNLTFDASAVPEPSTWLLMFAGIGGIGLMLRQAKRVPGFRFKHSFAA
jgi:hypothetical protein